MSEESYMDIVIDRERDRLFDELGLKRLRESYMRADEDSPQQRFAFVSKQFGTDRRHAQRLYDYASKHWLSYSTPILSFGRSSRGLPISCFLPYLPDSSKGLVDTLAEVNWLSMLGGGVGIGIGIRASDDKSVGVMPHLRTYDASSLAYRQGSTRRGSYAAYLSIDHPDIIQFLEMRKPTGDPNQRCLNLHHGINIPDSFMEIIERCMKDSNADDRWELKDPHNGEVREVVSAKELWMKILELRMMTGEPYLHFVDTSNRAMPEFQKALGLSIKQSNLCSEIILPTDEKRTAVCCLSSVNLEYYDEWKDEPLFLSDVAEMLDNVLQYFIDNAPSSMEKAKYSALRERSIGLGAMGFHAYLQKNNIAFESMWASSANYQMFKHIKEQALQETRRLAVERGACPDDDTCEVRNAHLLAIAPNASSSIICGNTSPSIEPFRANAFTQKTKSGSFLQKNKYLESLLESKGANTEIVWKDIITNKGSVQHLDILTDEEKEVFKTAVEINQSWVVEHAAQRQEFICQSQSVNLFFPPDVNKLDLHNIHMLAWAKNLKTLYYLRSEAISRADNVSNKVKREIIFEQEGCLSCEG